MLTPFKEILNTAKNGGYAVGAFNCLSLENVMGVIQAAEELRSPVILQLAEVQFPYSPLEKMAGLFLEAAQKATVPVAVHLDHGQSFETCARAIKLGFNSVMFDGAALPFNENVAITRQVVQMAKAVNVDVEAELGKVGDTGEGGGEGTGSADTADVFTDVEESARFLELTCVDALAIAIGNLHGKYVATPRLNIQRLKEIAHRNNIPLVLHGGTGTSEEDFKSCVHNGIAKINVATALQIAITNKIQQYLATASKPNYIDMKWKMIEATKEAVISHMLLFESDGKA
ncbi:MAG: class II fructose-bisphosphate aldolase [Bacteroidales bacterium]|nr:class II fructose-bisphosphate aldolase [Bacteroidales bacterium]